jgi:hypothetical protein
MIRGGFGNKRETHFEPPVEMRFVDLFMIIVVTLMFITVMLIIISSLVPPGQDVAPKISTKAMPPALVNQPYSLTLAGTGGANPYLWRIESGTLPTGLTLDSSAGVISGVPTQLERRQLTVELVDAKKRSDKREVSLQVRPAGKEETTQVDQIRVTSSTIVVPDATRDTPYSFRLAAEGGSPPYAWKIREGKLPEGLKLTPSGDLIGTPSSIEPSAEFAVAITDAIGASTNQKARILVIAPASPFWKRILGWVISILGWALTVVGSLVVCIVLYILSEGIPPTEPTIGSSGWKGFRRRMSEWMRS